mgnify:CR=1 FL=1
MKRLHWLFVGVALTAPLAPWVAAQTAPPAPAPAPAPAPSPAAATNPEAQLVSQFSTWAGSTDNATSLVQGLRTGGSITLVGAAPAPAPAPPTTGRAQARK